MDDPDQRDVNASIYTNNGPANTDIETTETRKPRIQKRTCESLRLNLKDAMEGKTWLLLPDGFRNQEGGKTYPLPTSRPELQKLIVIPIPANKSGDSGIYYLHRAVEAFKRRSAERLSPIDMSRKINEVDNLKHALREQARRFKLSANEAVEEVRAEAGKAIASLNDLFALGREGLGGIMKAHLAGEQWKGEAVSTDQFMGCFRMVSQAVKGLGLPSEQRDKARDAVMEEVAKSLESTRSAISGSTDDEVQH